MNDPSHDHPIDFVPESGPPSRYQRDLTWADAALIGGAAGGVATTLYSVVSTTYIWHFFVIAAFWAVCAYGIYQLRDKF